MVKETEGRPRLTLPRLKQASNVEYLAALLGTSYSKISYFYYKADCTKKIYYKQFTVAKKSGGSRKIAAPIPQLKNLQKKLAVMLNELYKPNESSHGFIENRSILTNAKPHTRKKFVFNIDLKDFFSSITFPRIYGLLTSKPYSLDPSVASVIAHLCTLDGYLPQGAPTSPIISNMICRALDRQLNSLARKNRATYTRYADDITFSFYDPYNFISGDIVLLDDAAGTYFALPGEKLSKIISSNRFSINPSKTRLQHKHERQIVTGLVVNKKPNIPREFIRKTCAMIHSIEVFGVDAAQTRYEKENPETSAHVLNVIYGRLLYIKSVVGYESEVYCRIARRFNHLNFNLKAPLVTKSRNNISKRYKAWAEDRCWIIETEWSENGELGMNQGSGFMVTGQLLITCAHVVNKAETITVHRIKNEIKHEAIVCHIDTKKDVAILKIKSEFSDFEEFHPDESKTALDEQLGLTVLGFPKYKLGAENVWVNQVSLVGRQTLNGLTTAYIDKELYAGNSGGPVLNGDSAVIGMVTKGNNDPDNLAQLYVDHSAFICFSAVLQCIREMQKKYSPS